MDPDSKTIMIMRLLAIIEEALEYAQDRYDTVDGEDGRPAPNDWMTIGNILEGKL
jgi:hypothetical protein